MQSNIKQKRRKYERNKSYKPWGCTHTHTHTICLVNKKIEIKLNIINKDSDNLNKF